MCYSNPEVLLSKHNIFYEKIRILKDFYNCYNSYINDQRNNQPENELKRSLRDILKKGLY